MTEPVQPAGPLESVQRISEQGRWTLIFSRELKHPIDKVWGALTEPGQLRLWSPYTADRNLAATGDVTIMLLNDDGVAAQDVPATVLRSDPPRLLEHSWGDDVLRWELTPIVAGTALTLRHTFGDERMTSAMAAGWHVCLVAADAVLSGVPYGPVTGSNARKYGWDELNQRYGEALGIEPSKIF
jgi:uncharacterized protein YndB with AHSA1/START domain